jgi:hypothetical protein
MACPNFRALLDFSLGNIDDNHAMQALGIDNDEDLFLLMAQAHLPMPRLPESNSSRMVDGLTALRK